MKEMEILKPNSYLTVYLPATNKALVFRVKGLNVYTQWCYGPLPLKAGETIACYDGGTVTIPADGVIPARGYLSVGKTFPLAGAYDEGDMWYTPEDWRERLFHVIQRITPAFLRVDVQIPIGLSQAKFQRDRITLGVDKDAGFNRGVIETIHIPKLHYGFRWGNDSNLNLKTSVEFEYGEYLIEVPRNPELIFDILTRRVPSYWYILPVTIPDPRIISAIRDTYGIEGFPVYRIDQKESAIEDYTGLLKNVLVGEG
jgi:hypothetical protein